MANINTFEPIEIGRTTSYNAGGLQVGLSQDGITATVTGKGEQGGVPFIEIQYEGTSTAAAGIFFNIAANNTRAVSPGDAFTCSLYGGVVGGSLPESGSFVCFLNFGPDPNQSSRVDISGTGGFLRHTVSPTVAVGKNTLINGGAYVRVPPGQPINLTVRVGGVQIERGLSATPVQIARSANDITEPGVKDLWHLYNDGGDSLNVTLPAGTYGLASIGIDRQIVIGTFVSDGTTPVNILRHERQLDVSYRLGAYSAAEELAIRDAWGRKYA